MAAIEIDGTLMAVGTVEYCRNGWVGLREANGALYEWPKRYCRPARIAEVRP